MRAYLNRDGRTNFNSWQEQIGTNAGAFAQFDFRPAPAPEAAAMAAGPGPVSILGTTLTGSDFQFV